MRINFNIYNNTCFSQATTPKMVERRKKIRNEHQIKKLLEPFTQSKDAIIEPLAANKGIPIRQKNVFDTFRRLDDVTHEIHFTRTEKSWDDCLIDEFEEFKVARKEYMRDKSQENFDHMEEEMGDIFYTAASIAKNSGINPEEAFRSTNLKFYNRINLMERLAASQTTDTPASLKDCQPQERRALWNAAKRKLYDAQSQRYINQSASSTSLGKNLIK